MANGTGINSINITDSGELYAAIPLVTLSEPDAEYKLAALTPNLDSSGRLSSITIDSEGTFYDSSNLPAITFNAPDGGVGTIPTVAATILNGRLTTITITDSGDLYDSVTPVITQTGGRAPRSNFLAQAIAVHDTVNEKITSLTITDSGDFYITAPTITITEPFASVDFIAGEQVNQDRLSDSSEVTAEVATFNKPDQSIQVINIGNTENGKFKEFAAGQYITGATSGARAKIKTRSNVWDSGDQNTIFATEIEDFLDFSEGNPFGEPNRSGEM